jgi:ribonucleoside-diphosphate reductase alpha chain
MTFSPFAESIRIQKYAHTKPDGTLETWEETAKRVAKAVVGDTHLEGVIWNPKVRNMDANLEARVERYIIERKFLPGGRYLAAAGREFHQVNNCLLLRAADSREGWAELMWKASMSLMTGAGIGIVYSDIRPRGSVVKRTGGTATGPCALMQMVNEAGRGIIQGGSRRSAIWAGLHWSHPDVFEFVALKNWDADTRDRKAKDSNHPAPMDGTNISVILDDVFFDAFHDALHEKHEHAKKVYWTVVEQMLENAEPGFSVDVGKNAGENLRNACTELTSADDSDICNLGSINLARIDSIEEMSDVVRVATAFLLAGTVYSDIPYPKVAEVRAKNRRLGLGLMGIHEWLLQRGKPYGPDLELGRYLAEYQNGSTHWARHYADRWNLSVPVKTRAIAPTGTIGILAETTTGIEPIFCAAYKRRYIKDGLVHHQYVLDPTAKKLVDAGTDPSKIEDAYTLANNVERRVAFQAWVQQYVDHGISSTINLPPWGQQPFTSKEFGEMLIKYLPQLRGVTCYPDGSRGGQPLVPVSWDFAANQVGQVFVEGVDICEIGKGGSCGS